MRQPSGWQHLFAIKTIIPQRHRQRFKFKGLEFATQLVILCHLRRMADGYRLILRPRPEITDDVQLLSHKYRAKYAQRKTMILSALLNDY